MRARPAAKEASHLLAASPPTRPITTWSTIAQVGPRPIARKTYRRARSGQPALSPCSPCSPPAQAPTSARDCAWLRCATAVAYFGYAEGTSAAARRSRSRAGDGARVPRTCAWGLRGSGMSLVQRRQVADGVGGAFRRNTTYCRAPSDRPALSPCSPCSPPAQAPTSARDCAWLRCATAVAYFGYAEGTSAAARRSRSRAGDGARVPRTCAWGPRGSGSINALAFGDAAKSSCELTGFASAAKRVESLHLWANYVVLRIDRFFVLVRRVWRRFPG